MENTLEVGGFGIEVDSSVFGLVSSADIIGVIVDRRLWVVVVVVVIFKLNK